MCEPKAPANIPIAKRIMRELDSHEGVTVTNWSKEGPGDSVKIDVECNGKIFSVAVEQRDNLGLQDRKTWEYDRDAFGLEVKYPNVAILVARMKKKK